MELQKLLFACALLSCTYAAPTCLQYVNMPGGDLPGMPLSVNSSAGCSAACRADSRCKLFTYIGPSSPHASRCQGRHCCWLKQEQIGGKAPVVWDQYAWYVESNRSSSLQAECFAARHGCEFRSSQRYNQTLRRGHRDGTMFCIWCTSLRSACIAPLRNDCRSWSMTSDRSSQHMDKILLTTRTLLS